MSSLVDFFKINIYFSKINCVHTTSDIYSYNIWNYLICNCHCGSNSAALTRVNIRHNTNLYTFCHWVITHTSNLLYGFILYYSCIADSCIYFSLDYKSIHTSLTFFLLPYSSYSPINTLDKCSIQDLNL